MNSTTVAGYPDYILGNTSAEYQRLHQQALLWEKITRRILKEAGLTRGMHCLEAGCGTGDIMRIAGDITGSTGSVTGMDIDGKIGKEALSVLHTLSNSQYFFYQADLESEPLPEAAYDFVYCRFLLIHIPDIKTMIRKLYRAVKPGGILLVQDYDFASFRVTDTTKHMLGYAKQLLLDIFTATGKDPEIGTTISKYFIETGIGKPAGTDAASIITTFPVVRKMLRDVLESMRPALVQLKITTNDRLQQFFDDMSIYEIMHENEFCVWPMLNSAWVIKPVA